MQYVKAYISPLGGITLSSDGESITGLWFDGQKYDRAALKNDETVIKRLPVFDEAEGWLDIYFSGRAPDYTPPVKVVGSDFKRTVTDIMLTIPYGSVMTYGEIAREASRRLGKERMSAQAVGWAVGHNPISLIIPCHRVVGADGSLTGYAGGVERKLALLKAERVSIEKLHIPKKGTAL